MLTLLTDSTDTAYPRAPFTVLLSTLRPFPPSKYNPSNPERTRLFENVKFVTDFTFRALFVSEITVSWTVMLEELTTPMPPTPALNVLCTTQELSMIFDAL